MRTALLIFLILCLPCRALARETLSVPEQRILYRAQQAMETNKTVQAKELLSSYLSRHPDTSAPLFFQVLGNACFQTEDLTGAATWYDAGLKKHPNNLILCRNLAAARYGLEDYQDAGKLFAKAWQLADPKEPELLYQSAISWYQAEKLQQSRKILEQLFAETPARKKPWMQLMIQVCYAQKALGRAETLLKNFLETYPQEREYWKLLSSIQTASRHYKEAAASLNMAAALHTPTPQEWEQLASLYWYLNAPLQGIRCLEKAAGSAPTPKQHDALAQRYTQVHRYADALRHLNQAIQQEPTPPRMLIRAKILFAERKFKDAQATLNRAIGINPDLSEAYLLLGYCALEQRNWHEADAAFRSVKKGIYLSQSKAAVQSIAPFLRED